MNLSDIGMAPDDRAKAIGTPDLPAAVHQPGRLQRYQTAARKVARAGRGGLWPCVAIRTAAFVPITLIFFWCFGVPLANSPSAEESYDNVPNFTSLATNCPPISYLLMRWRLGAQPPEICEYRAESNGVFVRATRETSFRGSFDLRDTLAGRWGEDYWFYTFTGSQFPSAPNRFPTLNTYHHVPGDTYSEAYVRVCEYTTRLRQYTTLGVATSASGKTAFDAYGNLSYEDPEDRLRITALFQYSNALPVLANLRITDAHGNIYTNNTIRYRYSEEIGNGRIPAAVVGNGLIIEISKITFQPPRSRIDKALFMPPRELTSLTNIQQVVYTNHGGYLTRNGRSVSMDPIGAAQHLREGTPLGMKSLARGYKTLIMAIFGLISALVLAFAIQRARRQNTNE